MSKTQKLPTVYKCPHVKISHQRLLDVGCCIELYHVPFIILWSCNRCRSMCEWPHNTNNNHYVKDKGLGDETFRDGISLQNSPRQNPHDLQIWLHMWGLDYTRKHSFCFNFGQDMFFFVLPFDFLFD